MPSAFVICAVHSYFLFCFLCYKSSNLQDWQRKPVHDCKKTSCDPSHSVLSVTPRPTGSISETEHLNQDCVWQHRRAYGSSCTVNLPLYGIYCWKPTIFCLLFWCLPQTRWCKLMRLREMPNRLCIFSETEWGVASGTPLERPRTLTGVVAINSSVTQCCCNMSQTRTVELRPLSVLVDCDAANTVTVGPSHRECCPLAFFYLKTYGWCYKCYTLSVFSYSLDLWMWKHAVALSLVRTSSGRWLFL